MTSTYEQVFAPPALPPIVRPRPSAAALWRLCLLAALAQLAACGRKATVEDCEQIVRRIAELELQGVVPEETLGAEVQEAQQAFRERALADCVGRRITEGSLACVASAATAEAVIDECFD